MGGTTARSGGERFADNCYQDHLYLHGRSVEIAEVFAAVNERIVEEMKTPGVPEEAARLFVSRREQG
ncbi:MAG: hypothetical protein JO305_08665 [Alphaproteobacteria bacterium]|nr:hypothetical protein [Alphaproteobacteria bacterium]